jgi:hypothetical protein
VLEETPVNWFGAAVLGIAAWQGTVALGMEAEKRQKFLQAEEYAQQVGKPFLVVGGPYGSGITGRVFHMKAHGCGDICLDLDAAACQGCQTTVADVRDIPYPDGYFGSAHVSHVLEHLPSIEDAAKALDELYRVADRVFICTPPKASIYAWFVSDHHLWINERPDGFMIQSWDGKNSRVY